MIVTCNLLLLCHMYGAYIFAMARVPVPQRYGMMMMQYHDGVLAHSHDGDHGGSSIALRAFQTLEVAAGVEVVRADRTHFIPFRFISFGANPVP